MMSDRVDPHRTAIKGRQTSARRVAADLWIFGRHDRTSQLRDLGLLANEAPRFSDMYVGRRKGPQGCLDECAMDRELRHGWIAAARPSIDLPSTKKKMIMTVQTRDKLMSLTDVSEMLGIPVQTLYRWRCKGDGPARLSGGPSCAVSQGGRRGLAGATSRRALLGRPV
jgi:hypothetical protein